MRRGWGCVVDPYLAPSYPRVLVLGWWHSYVTLLSAQVSQDKKVAAKNVQIRMFARHEDGRLVPCLRRGATPTHLSAHQTTYESAVYYHNNNPRFDETVRAECWAWAEAASCAVGLTNVCMCVWLCVCGCVCVWLSVCVCVCVCGCV